MNLTLEENIEELLQDLGPIKEEIAAILYVEQHHWIIERHDDLVVSLELDEIRNKLVFSIDIGTVNTGNSLKVYEALLSYNFLWKDSGGVKMALSSDMIVQIFDLDLSPFPTIEQFGNVLDGFVRKAQIWSDLITISLPDSFEPTLINLRV